MAETTAKALFRPLVRDPIPAVAANATNRILLHIDEDRRMGEIAT
jgi:hypothetical protein